MNNTKALQTVPSVEEEQVSRGLLSWLNQYSEFPSGIKQFDFEYLGEDKPCMALSTIQGPYITRQYVGGDYMASYQFKLIYRGQPGDSNNNRLQMDEVLNLIADSAVHRVRMNNKPNIGAGKIVRKIVSNTRAAFFGRYDNGDEDHQILMTLDYYSE